MNKFEILCELLIKKKNKLTTDEDEKKYNIVETLLKDKGCFFKMNPETAIGILEFLEVKEEDMLEFYYDLISPSSYKENIPSERIIMGDIAK